jgi:hypothetical protein
LECGLREKFEDACLNKPTSINYSFKGSNKKHSANKLRKTEDQSTGPLGDKWDEEDLNKRSPLQTQNLYSLKLSIEGGDS